MDFEPALIVVDMQNDFCPPNGTLAVTGARDIFPLINKLLDSSAFVLKIATQDYHPRGHVSFASSHPEKYVRPFESFVEIKNIVGGKTDQTMQLRVWPDHCVQGTPGAEIVEDIDVSKFDVIIRKGMDTQVEMYSAFHDSFGNLTAGAGGVSHDLAEVLKSKGVTDVYVVGLAGDYCVKDTAIGSARAGFSTYLLEEAQRCVDSKTWARTRGDLAQDAVKVVKLDSHEVKRLGIVDHL